MSIISRKELKRVCQKPERDPLWISHYVGRPLSINVTWICVHLGLSSNAVTFISLVFAMAGSIVLLWPSQTNYLAGAGMILFFFLLDHVDGEVARYERHAGKPTSGAAGGYFDRLVHYYQGPSMYSCLAAGLAIQSQNPWWMIPGIAAALGSSGFARFNAAFVLLNLSLSSPSEEVKKASATAADFNAMFWKNGAAAQHIILVPRNIGELKILAKQYFTFPGNLFAFASVTLLEAVVIQNDQFLALKAFLLLYSTILLANLIYSTLFYLKILKPVR